MADCFASPPAAPICRRASNNHTTTKQHAQVVKNEGVKSLFKGAGANILRAVAGAGVLSGYDQMQVIMFGESRGAASTRAGGGWACVCACCLQAPVGILLTDPLLAPAAAAIMVRAHRQEVRRRRVKQQQCRQQSVALVRAAGHSPSSRLGVLQPQHARQLQAVRVPACDVCAGSRTCHYSMPRCCVRVGLAGGASELDNLA
jgi:hypothetical protein